MRAYKIINISYYPYDHINYLTLYMLNIVINVQFNVHLFNVYIMSFPWRDPLQGSKVGNLSMARNKNK